MITLKRILVPVDFSVESDLAVQWAVKLAKEEKDATIYLLHVLPPAPPIVGETRKAALEQRIEADQRSMAKMKLEKIQKKIPAAFRAVVSCVRGDVVEEICSICRSETVDMVVMTTHGRTGVSRMVHPNVSEKAVRLAPCPVLVLHLKPQAAAVAQAPLM